MRTQVKIDVVKHNNFSFTDDKTGQPMNINQAEIMVFLPDDKYPSKIVYTNKNLPPVGSGTAILDVSTKKDKLVASLDFTPQAK